MIDEILFLFLLGILLLLAPVEVIAAFEQKIIMRNLNFRLTSVHCLESLIKSMHDSVHSSGCVRNTY